MRDLNELNSWRRIDRDVVALFGNVGDATVGLFEMLSPIDCGVLRIIASAGDGWDHVSVSRRNRCPNWPEMSFVAHLFFKSEEVAMQLHVPAHDHVNNYPFCLHWWRPHEGVIPRPPANMVGVKSEGVLKSREHSREIRRRLQRGDP